MSKSALNKKLLSFAISILAIIGFVVIPSANAATPQNASENIDICPGVDEARINQVDILILLDNSLSLSTGPTTDTHPSTPATAILIWTSGPFYQPSLGY